jgi:hypothetical protein
MRDVSDRLREMFDERQRQYQTRMNEIALDRSIRAMERGTERIRAEREFKRLAAGEATRPRMTDDDSRVDSRAGWIAIYGGLLGAAASIWAMIVYGHPPGFLAYAVVIGLGIVCGLDCSRAHCLGDDNFVLGCEVFDTSNSDRDSGWINPSDPASRELNGRYIFGAAVPGALAAQT